MQTALASIERKFEEFQASYSRQNYGMASDAFAAALRMNAGIAFRYFVTRASLAVATCLQETGRLAEVAEWLDNALAEFPDMHLLTDYDPALIQRVVDLRESQIAKGLQSVVLVTQGKSASISVANIFNSGFRLPSFAYSLVHLTVIDSWARDYARGGACYTTHLKPTSLNIRRLKQAGLSKVIVHVRDPRQSLVSRMHHFERYPDLAPALSRNNFGQWSLSDKIDRTMPSYVSAIGWIQGWMNAADELDVLFSSFEDFVTDRESFIDRYIRFYGAPIEAFSWEDATTQHEGTDFHFRKGLREEWREVFSPQEARHLTSYMPMAMRERFGWPD